MAKCFVYAALFLFVDASHWYDPKYSRRANDKVAPDLEKVVCGVDHETTLIDLLHQSSCGTPKGIIIPLIPKAASQQIIPDSVWIERCKGHCEYDDPDKVCSPDTIIERLIPVQIYDIKTNETICSFYPVDEHLSCVCEDTKGLTRGEVEYEVNEVKLI